MNDFEKLETELNGLYEDYVLKYRILSYLEKELEGHFRNQREKVQVSENVQRNNLTKNSLLRTRIGSITTLYASD